MGKIHASLAARRIWYSGISEQPAICHVFNFTPDRWDYDLRHLILDGSLALPGAQESLFRGLEQVYNSSNSADKKQAHGGLEAVGGESVVGLREGSKLTLFGESQALTKHQRLDSAIVNRDFNEREAAIEPTLRLQTP